MIGKIALCIGTRYFVVMRLRSSAFLSLARVYFIVGFIIGASGNQYSQSEIDEASEKLISREYYYIPVDNQTGCWPQNIIPYNITSGFTSENIQHIHRHMNQIQNRTCLSWVDLNMMSGVKKHVRFVYSNDPNLCETVEEYGPGNNIINPEVITVITLGDECFLQKVIMHEMLHALGFIHEHQRIDRDCYVIVNDDNARNEGNFKIAYDDNAFEKWPYDKRSITHYRRMTFTIRDKDEPLWGILYRHRLGDSYGWWGEMGESYEKLTCLDAFKINFRFCGAPDFCATQPEICRQIEEEELQEGCKDLYEQIVQGTVKPSKPLP